MQLVPIKKVIYLNSSQSLPSYLQSVEGVRWSFVQSAKELKEFMHTDQEDVIVVVKAGYLSLRSLESFSYWAKSNPRVSFMFIVQSMENSAYQMSLSNQRLLFIYESEGERIGELVTRRIHGESVRSRKQERVAVTAEVMLKKSLTAAASAGPGVQFLKEGEMRDFSQGGAKVSLRTTAGVKAKDFVSLMYRNNNGRWVSVESQVRWVVETATGEQIIGVQFLAVSA